MKLKKISIRGLAAYGICCLENAILHYGVKSKAWEFLLDKLWLFTSLPEIVSANYILNNQHYKEHPHEMIDLEILYSFFYECAIDNVVREAEGKKTPSENRITAFSEDERDLLFVEYKRSDDTLIHILGIVRNIPFAEWNGLAYKTPATMNALYTKKLIKLMQEIKIPLPDIEKFRKYTYMTNATDIATSRNGAEYGLPFNGKQEHSKILK